MRMVTATLAISMASIVMADNLSPDCPIID